MNEKNNSRGYNVANVAKKQDDKRNQPIGRDITKQYKRERDNSRIEERRQSIIGR